MVLSCYKLNLSYIFSFFCLKKVQNNATGQLVVTLTVKCKNTVALGDYVGRLTSQLNFGFWSNKHITIRGGGTGEKLPEWPLSWGSGFYCGLDIQRQNIQRHLE